MTLYVDSPIWPAHGTVWAHLVSDVSLEELHAFATRAGLARRAFDLDHYDVQAAALPGLVAAGAVATTGRDLVARLAASGLRVAGRDRAAAKGAALLARWSALLPGVPGAEAVGTDLLDRWSQPHRSYHGRGHLTHVLDSLVVLEAAGAAPRAVHLAAWFHDAVHDGVAGADEEASADLAEALLGPLVGLPGGPGAAEVAEVRRLVLVTVDHAPAAGDLAGAQLCDADLAILAGAPDRYARYVAQVRAEYAHVPDDTFASGRAAVLTRLLAMRPLFRTAVGAARWEAAARRNLTAELAGLTGMVGLAGLAD